MALKGLNWVSYSTAGEVDKWRPEKRTADVRGCGAGGLIDVLRLQTAIGSDRAVLKSVTRLTRASPASHDTGAHEGTLAMTDALPVAAAYARWAETYDLDVNATRDLDAAVLRATPLPLDGARVVEIGAGTGKNTAYLATRAATVLALDVSDAMLAKARARVGAASVRFLQHDLMQPWPVPAAEADLVVGNLVLEHVADLPPVFAAARRALRRGGLFVMAELHPYRQWRGAGAHFDGGQRVEAYPHAVSDYVAAGLGTGFALSAMAEIGDGDSATAPALPRLLQLVFTASG